MVVALTSPEQGHYGQLPTTDMAKPPFTFAIDVPVEVLKELQTKGKNEILIENEPMLILNEHSAAT